MRANRLKRGLIGAAVLSACSISVPAGAADFADRFNVYGFGSQDYLQTSANQYLGADKRGTWDNNFLGLVVSANVDERSKVWAQLEATSTEGTRFTWFFIDRQLTDEVQVHFGRVKFPLGLYNETIDAKSLQVTQLEPSLYQGGADMVHDAYHGAGIDYEQKVGEGHITWQAYGGNAYDLEPPEDSRDRRVFGARVTYRTPIAGLRFMLSGYRTNVEKLADKTMSNEDRMIASVDYSCDVCDVKAEYAKHKFFGVDSNAYYVQAGYTLTDKWSPYVRYDHVTLDKDQSGDPSYFQNTIVAGVRYRFADRIDMRAEGHFNHGYGLPVAAEEVAPGEGKRNWTLWVVGVNFTF
jgi:predicted porin